MKLVKLCTINDSDTDSAQLSFLEEYVANTACFHGRLGQRFNLYCPVDFVGVSYSSLFVCSLALSV